jgi:hypothetical protein
MVTAILLMRALTGYTVIERSRKGTGFDWWLGTEDNLFQGKVRLEVSGILRGTIGGQLVSNLVLRGAPQSRRLWQQPAVRRPAPVPAHGVASLLYRQMKDSGGPVPESLLTWSCPEYG